MPLNVGAEQLFLTTVWLFILFTHSVAYEDSTVFHIIYVPLKCF